MAERITIHDNVHGSITLDECASQLLETPELQRLAGIKQLGLACLVFPGANHTRLEHSIGTYYIATRITKSLNMSKEDSDLVSYAALLHDLGHGPYSHTLEGVFHDKLGIDHMQVTKDVICGKARMVADDSLLNLAKAGKISEILEEHSVDPNKIGNVICGDESCQNGLFGGNGQQFFNDKKYLVHLIHGPIDCDQIDYLLRDSHYTGVAHGTIDLARLLQTLAIHHNDLVVEEKGLSAVEGMLVARSLMYASVYFHKTVRISDLMLAKAVELTLSKTKPSTIQIMDDAELMGWLYDLGGLQKDIVQRLKFRKLYKLAYGKRVLDLSETEQKILLDITDRKEWGGIESGICQRAGLVDGSVIIDVPEPDLLLSEPRIARTDIGVLSDGNVKSLSKMTPFSKAIQQKRVSRWAFFVACDEKHVQKVAKAAETLIFSRN